MGFGIIVGLLIVVVNSHFRKDQFTDRTNWWMHDCLSESKTPMGAIYEEEEEEAEYYEGE